MDFGDAGDSYTEHCVNEYWDFNESRWVLADADGYYGYEQRFGYSHYREKTRDWICSSG